MSQIRVRFEGRGRTTEKAFDTIAETVEYLVKNGYTRMSGNGFYDIGVSTRLYKNTQSGRYARINTTSTPNTWLVIVEQIAAAKGAAK